MIKSEKGWYAVPGSREQYYCIERNAPIGAVLMIEPKPLMGVWIADEFGVWQESAMLEWVAVMEGSDSLMLRETEDLWGVVDILLAPAYVQGVYADKIALRATKPV